MEKYTHNTRIKNLDNISYVHIKEKVPVIKEWPNNSYKFNKNYGEFLYEDRLINKLTKNYFSLVLLNKTSKNSARMRNLIRRSSTKRLFVGKPEVKHFNDKIVYTLYVVNREKDMYIKRLNLLNKSLNRLNKYIIPSLNNLNHSILNINNTLVKRRILSICYPYNIDTNENKLVAHMNNKFSFKYKSIKFTNNSEEINRNKKIRLLSLAGKGMKYHKRNNKNELIGNINERKSYIGRYKRSYVNHKTRYIYNKPEYLDTRSYLKRLRFIPTGKLDKFDKLNKGKYNNIDRYKLSNMDSKHNNINKYKLNSLKINILRKKKHNLLNQNLANLLPLSFNNKKIKFFKSLMLLNFIKWVLLKFDVKVTLNKLLLGNNVVTIKSLKNRYYDKVMSYKSYSNLYAGNNKFNKIIITNNILFNILCVILSKGSNINNIALQEKIMLLYKEFKRKYIWDIIKRNFIRETIGIYLLYKLSIHKFKQNKFLLALKANLSKIYNKQPKINIVNLKYLHLNSDILIQAVTIKLKKKKGRVLRTLKKALKFVKLPKKIVAYAKPGSEKTLTRKSDVLKKLFPVELKGKFENFTYKIPNNDNSNIIMSSNEKKTNVGQNRTKLLNELKYKWVTGIKLETRGRLSKRYRADRSVFKWRRKGNLKFVNFKHIYHNVIYSRTPSMSMIRNQSTANIQYSHNNWNRRIGSYGVKGWISNS